MSKKKKKSNLGTVILILIFLVGLSLLLYPSFADYYNSFHQSRAIASYHEAIAQLDDNQYDEIWNEARAYNSWLFAQPFSLKEDLRDTPEYRKALDATGKGIMCYIEIPNIKVSLPVYHSTDETILQIAIGHVVGSSLPVGGESTHAVLSGHRGLPSARLFTDIDSLTVGDRFLLHVLDETLTYEVDQINIVLPADTELLEVVPGEDLCTLVTCTPYGVNSHRLLVRGHRVDTVVQRTVRVATDAIQIEPIIVAPVVAIPMLLLLLIMLLFSTRKKRY